MPGLKRFDLTKMSVMPQLKIPAFTLSSSVECLNMIEAKSFSYREERTVVFTWGKCGWVIN
jgi:hypothetical protein